MVLDEAEPRDNKQMATVIDLAKQSASGGIILRGGANHGGQEFTARAAFLFSSILIPPLNPQDVTRIAVLELLELPRRSDGAPEVPPLPRYRDVREYGAKLRQTITLLWGQWPQVLDAWRRGIEDEGFSARIADTWGTVLAMADLLLHAVGRSAGEVPQDEIETWCRAVAPDIRATIAGAGRDHHRMLAHLLGAQVDPVGRAGPKLPANLLIQKGAGWDLGDGIDLPEVSKQRAVSMLAAIGVKLVARRGERGGELWVGLAERHGGLNRIFRGTKWAEGVYQQSARRVPGWRRERHRLGTEGWEWFIMLPVRAVFDMPADDPLPEPAAEPRRDDDDRGGGLPM